MIRAVHAKQINFAYRPDSNQWPLLAPIQKASAPFREIRDRSYLVGR